MAKVSICELRKKSISYMICILTHKIGSNVNIRTEKKSKTLTFLFPWGPAIYLHIAVPMIDEWIWKPKTYSSPWILREDALMTKRRTMLKTAEHPFFPFHISSNPHLSALHGLYSSYLVHDVRQISFERLDDLRGDAVVDAVEEIEELFRASFAFEE